MDLDYSRSNFFLITIDLFFLLTHLVGVLLLYNKLLTSQDTANAAVCFNVCSCIGRNLIDYYIALPSSIRHIL